MRTLVSLTCGVRAELTTPSDGRALAVRERLIAQVKELTGLLELDRHVDEPVDLVVGDRIVAKGEVVIVDGNFALLVTEVAEPQLRLESIRSLF